MELPRAQLHAAPTLLWPTSPRAKLAWLAQSECAVTSFEQALEMAVSGEGTKVATSWARVFEADVGRADAGWESCPGCTVRPMSATGRTKSDAAPGGPVQVPNLNAELNDVLFDELKTTDAHAGT